MRLHPVFRGALLGVFGAVFLGEHVGARPLDASPRPFGRQHAEDLKVDTRLAGEPSVLPMSFSPRPQNRPARLAAQVVRVQEGRAAAAGFERWWRDFRPRAMAAGITSSTFDRAFETAEFRSEVLPRDRNQSEFSTALWDYLDRAVSDTRVRTGQEKYAQHARVLERIEAHFGVDKEVVLAVWGMETNYGSFRGSTPTLAALATLAYDGRRGAFFEAQLIDALKIVQAGDVAPGQMVGSWAGAMGHTQFMPTSYLAYAVDFTGDGRRDVWSEDPTDALASTAAYLARFGWQRGQPWGVEVRVPQGFDYALAQRSITKSPRDWAALGVTAVSGGVVPNHGEARLLLPAGAQGPAFLTFQNFNVIKRYNAATSYAMGVGHLADRIGGAGDFQTPWPRGDQALSRQDRKELQTRLTALGFDTGGVDGRLGPNSLRALRAYQRSVGLPPDGYAHGGLLQRLRGSS